MDIEELIACKVGAASNSGCGYRLYNTVTCCAALWIHLGGRQVNDNFQRAADICELGILDKGDLGHYEASAMFHCRLYLVVLGLVLPIFLEHSLAVLARIFCGHQGDDKICSLARLSLPRVLVDVLDRAESINKPFSASFRTCFVQL